MAGRSVLDRVLARFTPIASWNVIGPFPRVTPQVFIGKHSIDFGKTTIGATGRQVAWTNRRGDATSGRVDLDDLIPRDQAPDSSAPPESPSAGLGEFAYAEVNALRACPALLLASSSGALMITVNEDKVCELAGAAGHSEISDPEVVRAT